VRDTFCGGQQVLVAGNALELEGGALQLGDHFLRFAEKGRSQGHRYTIKLFRAERRNGKARASGLLSLGSRAWRISLRNGPCKGQFVHDGFICDGLCHTGRIARKLPQPTNKLLQRCLFILGWGGDRLRLLDGAFPPQEVQDHLLSEGGQRDLRFWRGVPLCHGALCRLCHRHAVLNARRPRDLSDLTCQPGKVCA
jgi:hypothetical protein